MSDAAFVTCKLQKSIYYIENLCSSSIIFPAYIRIYIYLYISTNVLSTLNFRFCIEILCFLVLTDNPWENNIL